MSHQSEPQTIVDCKDAAEAAGLSYASPDGPGFTRRRAGRGFGYWGLDGAPLIDAATVARIRALAIPPAWTSVRICPDPHGHIQAVGQDEKGRKQYRYHPRFREIRDGVKFEHMIAFADALPRLRRQVALDMASPGLGRTKVLATVVHLLETTMIRVGNEAYAKENKSYGLTTLLARHVKIDGADLRFHFKGKSGRTWRLSVRDRRIARIVKNCQELPGQHLFQFFDDAGELQAVTSGDVNVYLKEVSGAEITAKDFRTWTGTVLAAMALSEFEIADSAARAKRNVTQAIERVSAGLGNTPTICRKCYIHPEVVSAYLDGGLWLEVQKGIDKQLRGELEGLRPGEAAVLSLLRARRVRDLAASNIASPTVQEPATVRPSVRIQLARRRSPRANGVAQAA
jgi:DNA topoisomerase-1